MRDYKNNYKTYISNKNNKDNSSKNKNIRFFFEKIDDKNLNDKQKKDLANLLKKVITFKKESNIFYLVEGIKNEIVGKSNANLSLDINIKDIIAFYEGCVKNDFKNFIALDKKNCKYADVIKYVLCYGSCLNYNGGNEGGMNVDYILNQLNLKANIKSKDEEFFEETYNVKLNVIENFKKGFNQIFIIDLLKILPLEEYYEILDHDISANRVNFYFERKIYSQQMSEEQKERKEKNKKRYFTYLDI